MLSGCQDAKNKGSEAPPNEPSPSPASQPAPPIQQPLPGPTLAELESQVGAYINSRTYPISYPNLGQCSEGLGIDSMRVVDRQMTGDIAKVVTEVTVTAKTDFGGWAAYKCFFDWGDWQVSGWPSGSQHKVTAIYTFQKWDSGWKFDPSVPPEEVATPAE